MKATPTQPDPKILPHFQQFVAPYARFIAPITDTTTRDRILSFFYYAAECEYCAFHPSYTPPRLIGDNTALDALSLSPAGPDFIAAHRQVMESFLHYAPRQKSASV